MRESCNQPPWQSPNMFSNRPFAIALDATRNVSSARRPIPCLRWRRRRIEAAAHVFLLDEFFREMLLILAVAAELMAARLALREPMLILDRTKVHLQAIESIVFFFAPFQGGQSQIGPGVRQRENRKRFKQSGLLRVNASGRFVALELCPRRRDENSGPAGLFGKNKGAQLVFRALKTSCVSFRSAKGSFAHYTDGTSIPDCGKSLSLFRGAKDDNVTILVQTRRFPT